MSPPLTPHHGTLVGKVALVTGAGSGIGEATAYKLAEAGARVGVLTHTAEEAEHVAGKIRDAGGEAIALTADVSDESQMEAAVRTIEGRWKQLDIVVANAGINGLWAPLEEITTKDWQKTLSVNLEGTFLTLRTSLPLLKRRGGAVVIISSVNGTRIFSNTGASAYSSSKAAQVAFARMSALELATHKVRVNTVCPGSVKTNISDNTRQKDIESIKIPVEFPEGSQPLTGSKPATPEQVARLIWFLVSDLADHITGAEVFIDGGESLLRG